MPIGKKIRDLNKDIELINILKKQIEEGKLTVDQISILLNNNKITLPEFISITQKDKEES